MSQNEKAYFVLGIIYAYAQQIKTEGFLQNFSIKEVASLIMTDLEETK